MGKIVRKKVDFGGTSNSAEKIKYDDTTNVKEAIDEVKAGLDTTNSNLVKKTYGSLPLTSAVKSGGIKCAVSCEGFMTINGSLSVVANTTPGTSIATLPHRPARALVIIGTMVDDDANYSCIQIIIGTDGTIKPYPSASVTETYSLFIDSCIALG